MDDLSKPRRSVLGDCTMVQRGHRVDDRSERVAQLVGQRGEEFILGTIGIRRLAIELSVVEEDTREVADTLDQTDLPLGDRPPRRPPDHEEAADRPVLDTDRDEEVGLVREVPKRLRIDARVAGHVVGPHCAPVNPRLLDCPVAFDRNRNPPECIEHVVRYAIAGRWPQALARRVGEVGADRIRAERQCDFSRHSPHRLRRVKRRAQRATHGEQCLRLAQAQLLSALQLRPLRLGQFAASDIPQDGEVTTGYEPRRGTVLDVPYLAVGANHAQLSGLLAGVEKALPRCLEIHARLEEIIEATAEQIGRGHAKQSAGGRIDVNERPRVVDDDHGVTGGREKSVGLLLAGHQTRATAVPIDSQGDLRRKRYLPAARGPRRTRPGWAPLCSPSRSTTWPFTIEAWKPVAFCRRRRAPAGRSFTTSGMSGATRSGSKTITSAASPSRSSPRSCRPQADAGSKLSIRTPSSSVSAWRRRTQ